MKRPGRIVAPVAGAIRALLVSGGDAGSPGWISHLKLGLSILLLLILLFLKGTFEPLELMTYDVRMRAGARIFSSQRSLNGDSPVVLVVIDDASLQQIGQWPWPRSIHARLTEILSRAGAKAIGFDIMFSEPDTKDIIGDKRLADASIASGNVVLAGAFAGKFMTPGSRLFQGIGEILPLEPLRRAATGVGHIVALPDDDGVVRRVPVAVKGEGRLYFSLPVELARVYLGISEKSMNLAPGRYLELVGDGGKPLRIPLDATGSMFINYLLGLAPSSHGMLVVPYHQVLAGKIPSKTFKGKAVIIGMEARGLRDFYPTPLSVPGGVTSGLRINAMALDTILSGAFIKRVSPLVTVGMMAAGSLAAGAAGAFGVPGIPGADAGGDWGAGRFPVFLHALFPALISMVFAIGAGFALLWRYGLWLDIVPVVTAIAVSYIATLVQALVVEEKKRYEVRKTFERYLAPEVVREILSAPGGYALGGSRRKVTILFADIRGFTTFASVKDPEMAVNVLNQYLKVMGEAVIREGGALDKFMGDGIMAIFGAPAPLKDHASRAIKAAIEILDEVGKMEYGLRVGIGISSGDAVVGNIGTGRRMDYTAIGNTVNIASRLEELAGPQEILMDGASFHMVRGQADGTPAKSGSFESEYAQKDETPHIPWEILFCEGLGQMTLRGLSIPVEIWKVTIARGQCGANYGQAGQ